MASRKEKNEKEVKRGRKLKDLFSFEINDGMIVTPFNEVIIFYEVEGINEHLLTTREKIEKSKLFENLYNTVNHTTEIVSCQFKKNYDIVNKNIHKDIDNSVNKYTKFMFQKTLDYLNSHTQENTNEVRYFLKFVVKSTTDFNKIDNAIVSSFRNEQRIRKIDTNEVVKLLDNSFNHDFLRGDRMSIEDVIGGVINV